MLNKEVEAEAGAIAKMHAFNLASVGTRISWSYVIRDEKTGDVEFVEMSSRPCYGEMRRYGKGSTRPQDYKPGDLPRPIKKGIREGVSVYIHSTNNDIEIHNEFVSFMLSTESPYRKGIGFNGLEMTTDDKGRIVGVVMYDTEVDPTTMVALFMFLRSSAGYTVEWDRLVKEGKSKIVALIASVYARKNGSIYIAQFGGGYYLTHKLDVKKFVNGEVNSLSNGRTWRDQEDYNRPEIQDLFQTTELEPFTKRYMAFVGATPSYSRPISELPKVYEYIEKEVTEALAA